LILNNMKWEKWLFTVVHQIKQLSWMPPILQTAYMWICYYSNQEWYCFPSQKLLAENCWVSINAIRKYLAELEKIWLIKRERRYKDNMELSSIYQLVIGISQGVGGVYQQVGEGIAPDGDGTISTELNPKELDSNNPENTEDKEIPDTKYNKKEWEDFSKQEWFASYTARVLLARKWKPDETIEEFSEWIAEFMKIRNIKYNEWDFIKWKWAFQSMFSYWDELDKGSRKRKIWKSRMWNQKGFNFNLK